MKASYKERLEHSYNYFMYLVATQGMAVKEAWETMCKDKHCALDLNYIHDKLFYTALDLQLLIIDRNSSDESNNATDLPSVRVEEKE